MRIYLDIETTRFFSDPEIARLPRSQQIPALAASFGCGVTYDAVHGWRSWLPEQVADLWAALAGHQIAGWNVIHFDIPLIQEAARLAGAFAPDLDPWTDLDLFAEIRARTSRWYRLEEIAQANLGRGKSADGQRAAEWLRSGDPDLMQRAADYCRLDVELVIHLHALASVAGLVLPPRTQRADPDPTTYRYWISPDGDRWKLAVDGGATIAQFGWDDTGS